MVEEKISYLLEDIASEKIGLPEIQRDFIWSEQKARDLIDSLYKKFPIGVILLWRSPDISNFRLLQGQDGKQGEPERLILDGQQRLTSLSRIKEGKIKLMFNIKDENFSLENRTKVNEPNWVRVDDIWKKGSTNLAKELSQKHELSIDEFFSKYISRIQQVEGILDQTISVFDIRENDYSRITEMYMRLNEKGTKLKKAEINLALIVLKFPKVFHKRLIKLVEDFEGWELEANFFLRCFVCISTNQSKYEPLRKYLNSASKEKVLQNLEKISEHLENTFNFIISEFGINENNNLKLIPSEIALIPLMMYHHKYDGKVSTTSDLEKLSFWFFTASHYGRYSGTTESTLNEDLKALQEDDPLSTWVENISKDRGGLDMRELRGRINNTNLFALYYAIRKKDALDWWSGTKIENTNNIEFHHIFPKKVLRDEGYPDNMINDIRNIAIVSRKANRKISAMKPKEYFTQEIGEMNWLFSQFVPKDEKFWEVNNYKEFLEEREKNIILFLNKRISKYSSNLKQ